MSDGLYDAVTERGKEELRSRINMVKEIETHERSWRERAMKRFTSFFPHNSIICLLLAELLLCDYRGSISIGSPHCVGGVCFLHLSEPFH